ncbi:hypothetical protein [Paenibacillus herberti]|uniref:Uncharacterized protein n=1 Tax=Paenibacillus herberti TaxID=1619309 RepID=A0A229P3Q3_9BACL|nr:hypothetical protein [Paenibacillus herberti]OXM16758.1 hypothetical protein CGZ75_08910 [Paenibacillus herberti]
MKRKTASIWMVVLSVLAVIGLFDMLLDRNYVMLLPLAVLAIIFALYKWNPGRRNAQPRIKPRGPAAGKPRSASTAAKNRVRKTSPFRVIDGGKDDDSMPKYH